jgi:hypothetical protein
MSESVDARYARISRLVGGVLREALRTTGTSAIVLLDAESPEGVLTARIAAEAGIPLTDYSDSANTLTAHPANKTVLLTGEFFPRSDLLPLGDLYATQVALLAGGWTGDDAVQDLAAAMGGIGALDAALQRHLDERQPIRDLRLAPPAAQRLETAISRTRFRRGRAGLVPKIGARSIGVDLLD